MKTIFSGLILVAFSLLLSLNNLDRFLQSYLFSYLWISEFAMGSMALLMISNLTGGAWAERVQPVLKASVRTVYLLGILFIPILLGAHRIYPWALTPLAGHQGHYLNVSAFTFRAIFYLLSWTVLSQLLLRMKNLQAVSAAGLVFYVFSGTFSAIDWQMSLEPHWYSTIYGLIYLIGQALGAWAFTLLIRGSETPKVARDLGNLLLAFIMLWAYLNFMQYLVIWSGDLPEEVTWLNHRMQGGWQYFAIILIFFQFFAPFASLLFRRTKEHRRSMILLCSMVLVIRVVDRYWMVMPALHPSPTEFAWTDLSLVLGLGAVWFGTFSLRYKNAFQ